MSKKIENKKVLLLAGSVLGAILIIGVSAYYIGAQQAQTSNGKAGNMDFNKSNGTGRSEQGGRGMGNGGMMQESQPIVKDGELTVDEQKALKLALADELKAVTFYKKVIAKFGDVRPFTNIVQSETQHISRLHAVYNAYDMDIPDITPEEVSVPSTVSEACEVGVQAEIENAALYDKLMSMTDKQSILDVFTFLSEASTNNHKVAFERCGGN